MAELGHTLSLDGPIVHSKEPEPDWSDLWDLFKKGRVIPFLGSGASAFGCSSTEAMPPTVAALIQKLATRSRLDINCPGCHHPRFDLARLASYYQKCVGTRSRLDDFLKDEIANPRFVPNGLHHLLARIARVAPMLIITTNYDSLLEKAFDSPSDGGTAIPYEIVVTPADELAYADADDESQLGPDHAGAVLHWESGEAQADFKPVLGSDLLFDLTKRSVIYKIHGSVPRGATWQGGYLIAEEDYARFLGRMERRSIVPDSIRALIQKKIKVGSRKSLPLYSIMFLGYGMRDWNLRVLFEELHVGCKSAGEEVHYAFVKDPDLIDKQLLERRNVRVHNCDLASFATKLSEFL